MASVEVEQAERVSQRPASRIRYGSRAALRALRVVRVVRDWPGVGACVLAYAVTAAVLYPHQEVQLLGLLAALVVGVAWYASPARAWEAGRRRRQAAQDGRAGAGAGRGQRHWKAVR